MRSIILCENLFCNVFAMKIGVCFGTYAPLHQGHLDVIMRAKKENDKCLVFVCGGDNDHGYDCGLSIHKRYRLVKKFFEDDENIKVMCVDENSLGLDFDWNDTNWNTWLSNIYDKLQQNKISGEITRYVSKESYKEALDKNIKNLGIMIGVVNNPTILLEDSQNLISGVNCRENPLKYWDKIAYPFRGNFSHNILVLGTMSEGKTTLVRDIAKYFGLVYSEEYVRLKRKKTLKEVEELACKDFIDFINGQYLLNRLQIDCPSNTGIFISDTSELVPLVYAKRFATLNENDSDLNNKFSITKSEYEAVLKPLAKVLQKGTKWNKIFFLTTNSSFVDDGARYNLMASVEERQMNEKLLYELLDEFGLMDKVEFLKGGSYYENFCKVKKYIEGLV